MIIKEIKKIKDHEKAYQLIKKGKIKFNCPVLILHQATGFYYTRPLIVEGVKNECIQYLMDELYNQYKHSGLPFPVYSLNEVLEDIGEEAYNEYLYDFYMPLNGGEFYTDTILWVEEV